MKDIAMNENRLVLSVIVALAGFLPSGHTAESLGSASSFAVLGGSTVTSTGTTVLNGNLGVAPGTAITGFPPGFANGTTYDGGAVAQQAQNDALAYYTTLMGLAPNQNLTGENLGGLTLTPGVYDFTSTAQLTGTLTLNAQGNPNAKFIFQIGDTLTAASSSAVVLENDASAFSVSWVLGSSATLGTGTAFNGNILAHQSITMNTGASLSGSAVALNGAVTLDDNHISVSALPEPNSFLSGGLCAALLGGGRWLVVRRRQRRAIFANQTIGGGTIYGDQKSGSRWQKF